jgi:hypothetical protein
MMESEPSDPIVGARRCEEAFLAGIGRNVQQLPRRLANPFGRWGTWKLRADRSIGVGWDRGERIKPAMIAAGCYDRTVQAAMPRGGGRLWTWRRRFWNRPREVAIVAASLAPLDALAAGEPAPKAGPAALGAVLEDVTARHKGGIVLMCMSPGGWEADTFGRTAVQRRVRIVLIEPWPAGGFRVLFDERHSPPQESWMQVADPETAEDKRRRVRTTIQQRRADVLTGGIDAAALAEELDVPAATVADVFRETAAADPRLRLEVARRSLRLYHAPTDRMEGEGQEKDTDMGLFQKLFGKKPDERRQIEVLSAKRSVLTSRRDDLFRDISALEAKEQQLLDEGAAAENATTRKRVAAQLSMLRKDIGRRHRLGNMIGAQIDIVGSQIGNLQLIVEGRAAKLPTEQELVDTAVKADAVIREVSEAAEQVHGLEEAMTGATTVADEDAILAEFEQRAEKRAAEQKAAEEAAAKAQAEAEKQQAEAAARRAEAAQPPRERLVVDLDEEKKEEELEEGA